MVFLGANNALQAVTRLDVLWSGPDYADLVRKSRYTVWTPTHFRAELGKVVTKVRAFAARHVIWCTVPHVTIAPIAHGVGEKVATGSRYFPYYTRPWVDTDDFRPDRHKHITGGQVRAVDYAIDSYNDAIQDVVHNARAGVDGAPRDAYCSTPPGCWTGWRRVASSRIRTRGRSGGLRSRCPPRCRHWTRLPIRTS